MSSLPQPPLNEDIDSVQWKRVSGRYLKLRLAQRSVWTVILVLLCAIPLVGNLLLDWGLPAWSVWSVPAAMLLWQLILFFLIPRQIRSWGYAEYPEHLLVTKGLLTKRTTAIPYGRMQLVDVKSGPIENMLKLATVELQTAAAGTNAVIHGLDRVEADRLREALTTRGEERMVKM